MPPLIGLCSGLLAGRAELAAAGAPRNRSVILIGAGWLLGLLLAGIARAVRQECRTPSLEPAWSALAEAYLRSSSVRPVRITSSRRQPRRSPPAPGGACPTRSSCNAASRGGRWGRPLAARHASLGRRSEGGAPRPRSAVAPASRRRRGGARPCAGPGRISTGGVVGGAEGQRRAPADSRSGGKGDPDQGVVLGGRRRGGRKAGCAVGLCRGAEWNRDPDQASAPRVGLQRAFRAECAGSVCDRGDGGSRAARPGSPLSGSPSRSARRARGSRSTKPDTAGRDDAAAVLDQINRERLEVWRGGLVSRCSTGQVAQAYAQYRASPRHLRPCLASLGGS